MKALIPRLLILALAEVVLLPAVHGIGPLLIAGSERYLLVGTGAGMALATLWLWSDWALLVATEALAITLALGLQALPQPTPAAGRFAGLSIARAAPVVLAPAGAVALTVATVCLAGLCGWLLGPRRTPWPVVALGGSLLLVRANVSHLYEEQFPLFLVAAVALVVCVYSPTVRRLWVAIPTLVVAVAVIAVSWQLPAGRTAIASGWLDPLAGLAVSGAFHGQQDQLPLQGTFQPSSRPVMTIADSRPDLHLYWRLAVFTTYDGHGWSTPSSPARAVAAGAPLGPDAVTDEDPVFAQVQLHEPAQVLVFPGVPAAASLPSEVMPAPGGTAPIQVQAQDIVPAGAEYQVEGDTVDAAPLSPEERAEDLQLPSEPGRVADLAQRLTRPYGGALAQAQAITSYLRNSGVFQYDAGAGSPSTGDAVDDFLFRAHRGYCDQFASALVVLARSAGIPARLVTGYAPEAPVMGSYLIRERDAHSWADVYTAAGWVQLDPTPGFVAEPSGSPGTAGNRTGNGRVRTPPPTGTGRGHLRIPKPVTAAAPTSPHHGSSPLPLLGGAAAGTAIALALAAYAVRPRSLDALYRSAVRAAPKQYGRLDAGDTPYEFAERFRAAPAEYEDVRILVELYVRRCYAGRQPTEPELQAARRAWWRLRRRWFMASLPGGRGVEIPLDASGGT